MDIDREKKIGLRLRIFRETLQIPRTKFALSIGCGSEQVAAYESGRARLPYRVFRAISKRYDLYPLWLAEEFGSPQLKNSFNDSAFLSLLPKHALFSDVFDKYLSESLKISAEFAQSSPEEVIGWVSDLAGLLKNIDPKNLNSNERALLKKIEVMGGEFSKGARNEIRRRSDSNLKSGITDLTRRQTQSSLSGVKPLWPKLKRRLQSTTTKIGGKSKLAEFLGVKLSIVSRWLSEKSEREPGAEYTLQMLHWVEQQERQK